MERIIEFPLENGGTILIEVEEPISDSGIDRAGRLGEIAERAAQTLEATLEPVKPAAEAILKFLTSLSQQPQEMEVEFGLKVTAESGAIIAKGTLEANFVVRLKWARENPIR